MPGLMMMVAMVWAGPESSAKEAGIFPFAFENIQLENGFTAYLIPSKAPGLVTYVTMVRTGSRDEFEEGKSGFAHFFEHMMFRGTEKHPNFDDVISGMGADSNAFTSNDMTVYYITGSSEYLEKIIDLESDRFMNLAYSEAGFRTEAGAVLGEYLQSKFSPMRWLNKHVRELVYTEHTYRHSTIGFEPDIRAMPEGFAYSQSFYDRYYRPENCVLLVVGDFDVTQTRKWVEQYYASWKPGYVPPSIPEEPEQTSPRETQIEYPRQTLPIVSIEYRAPAWSATDAFPVAIRALGELAFGENSALYRELVLEKRWVQRLQTDFSLGRDPSTVSIAAMISSPDHIGDVHQAIQRTVDTFGQQVVNSDDLKKAKDHIKYSFLMSLETPNGIAFSLIPPIINTGTLEAVNQFHATLEAVTPEEVRSAAERLFIETGRSTVTMVQAGGQR